MLKRSINHNKLKFLFISMAIFSIVYLIFDDNNFSGVNYIKEKVKDEVFKKKVEKNIKKETDKEGFSEVNDLETKIDETVKSAKNEIEQDELIDEKMNVARLPKRFVQKIDDDYFVQQQATDTLTPIEVGLIGNDGYIEVIGIPTDSTVVLSE